MYVHTYILYICVYIYIYPYPCLSTAYRGMIVCRKADPELAKLNGGSAGRHSCLRTRQIHDDEVF